MTMGYPEDIMHISRHIWIISVMLTACDGNPDAKRLYDDLLMKGYDSNVRPTTSLSDSTKVKFGLRLSQVVAVDEINQIMTVNVWAEQVWIDPRLRWNVFQYNNISMLFVPAELVWRPDIVLYNNADGDYTITSMGKAVISPDGQVRYGPPMQFKSSCELDVEYFPFDIQLCKMKFGPWTHDASKVDILHLRHTRTHFMERETIEEGMILTGYQTSVEWDLMKVGAQENLVEYPCCPGQYFADVTFHILLRRKHLYYVINLIVPCMSMNILTVLAFYLPSYSGEKIGVTISVFLSLSIFQLVLFDLTPSTSKLPLIGKYITVTSFLVTISVMTNAIILNINHRLSTTHEMSHFMRWLFLGILSRLLYMRLHSPKETDTHQPDGDKPSRFSYKYWKQQFNEYGTRTGANERVNTDEQLPYADFDLKQWDLDKVCQACYRRNMSKCAPTLQKGHEGICFIAKHYHEADEGNRVKDEWRYVALVLDRVLLLVYVFVSLVVTMQIFMNAPALYDSDQPITIPK